MKTIEITIGIDLGLSGGISFFDTVSGEFLSLYSMPTMLVTKKDGKEKSVIDIDRLNFILEIPNQHKDGAIVFYEDVHARPGEGVVSVGTLLEQKGIIKGICTAHGYLLSPIGSPKTWQKPFGIVCPKEIEKKEHRKKWLKNKSLEVAREKFPQLAEGRLSKSTDHGLSDALLIGLWGLEHGIDFDVKDDSLTDKGKN